MALPGFTLRTAEDEYDRTLLADIERFGWHIVHINEDKEGPAYSFSVGFYYTFQRPEILVMGLPQAVAHKILQIAVVHMAGGKTFQPFDPAPDFVEGFNSAFAPIEIEHYQEYLGYAIWFYRSLPAPFPAWQLVWPDKQGCLPWESGYDTRFLKLQRPLYAVRGKSDLRCSMFPLPPVTPPSDPLCGAESAWHRPPQPAW